MASKWRQYAAPIIAAIIDRHSDEKQARDELRLAYPFGPRANHPYAIWCEEVNRQASAKWPKRDETEVLPLFGSNNEQRDSRDI